MDFIDLLDKAEQLQSEPVEPDDVSVGYQNSSHTVQSTPY